MNTPRDDLEPLMRLLEEHVEVSPNAREDARRRMQSAIGEPSRTTGAGTAEIIRLTEESGSRSPGRSGRWRVALGAVAAVVTVLGVGMVATRSLDAPSDPVPAVDSVPAIGSVLDPGTHTVTLDGQDLSFTISESLVVSAAEPSAIELVPSESPDLGTLTIASNPNYVGAPNLEQWLTTNDAETQETFAVADGETLTVVDVVATPGCRERSCPLSDTADVSTQPGTRLRLIERRLDGTDYLIAGLNRSMSSTVQDLALEIATTLSVEP